MGRRQQAEDGEKSTCRGCGEDSKQRMRRRQQAKDAEKTSDRGCGEDSKQRMRRRQQDTRMWRKRRWFRDGRMVD